MKDIMFEGQTHKSAEHLFQYLKADEVGCTEEMRQRIKDAPSGVSVHNIGDMIKSTPTWDRQELPTMKLVLREKYKDEQCKRELLETDPHDLVFACEEQHWGGGEVIGSKCYDRGFYPGRNEFGKLLMQIRCDLM